MHYFRQISDLIFFTKSLPNFEFFKNFHLWLFRVIRTVSSSGLINFSDQIRIPLIWTQILARNDFRNAIPMIMGANIGTSVTNTIVSFTQVKKNKSYGFGYRYFGLIRVWILVLCLSEYFGLIGPGLSMFLLFSWWFGLICYWISVSIRIRSGCESGFYSMDVYGCKPGFTWGSDLDSVNHSIYIFIRK